MRAWMWRTSALEPRGITRSMTSSRRSRSAIADLRRRRRVRIRVIRIVCSNRFDLPPRGGGGGGRARRLVTRPTRDGSTAGSTARCAPHADTQRASRAAALQSGRAFRACARLHERVQRRVAVGRLLAALEQQRCGEGAAAQPHRSDRLSATQRGGGWRAVAAADGERGDLGQRVRARLEDDQQRAQRRWCRGKRRRRQHATAQRGGEGTRGGAHR